MAKRKKTPKQQMKYWRVRGLIIKARTARVAVRKYLRGNLVREIISREFELDNPFSPTGETFDDVRRFYRTTKLSWNKQQWRRWVAYAKAQRAIVTAVEVSKPS